MTAEQTDASAADVQVGRRVHMMMWDRRMKQTDVARLIGVQQSGFSKKLRGDRGWSVSDLVTMARVLSTSVAYLVGETQNPHPVEPSGDALYAARESNPQPADPGLRRRRLRLASVTMRPESSGRPPARLRPVDSAVAA